MEHQQTWGERSIINTGHIVHHGIQTTMQVDVHVIKKDSPQGRIHKRGTKEATY